MTEEQVIALVTSSFGGRWSSATPLTGGLVNQVWRLSGSTGSLIAKYAPPFVASRPEVPLSPLRLRYEALCLNHFGGRTGAVSSPRLLAYFKAAGMVLMEDCGDLPDLGAVLKERTVDGRPLGEWLRALHTRTAGHSEFRALLRNRDVQEVRFEEQYCKVGGWLLSQRVPDAERLGGVAEALGNRLLREGRCVIMGDLWPRSVLVAPSVLRVIDWEFSHFGSPVQDVAHLAAHCWMGAHCAADDAERARWRRFLEQFLEAYGDLAQADSRDSAIHVGAEILARTVGPFRGDYLYASSPLTGPLVRAAVDVACSFIREWSLESLSAAGDAWPAR
jgi:5-methylthioribose kinase